LINIELLTPIFAEKIAMRLDFLFVLVVFCLQSCAEEELFQVGNDAWMVENLRVKTFRNGDPILEAKTQEEWLKAGQDKLPAFCIQENLKGNEKTFGILYNAYAVRDVRGLAPKGFHISTDQEWERLIRFLGGNEMAGGKLKDPESWSSNHSAIGSGFNARPGGVRIFEGSFSNVNRSVYFWTSTEESTAMQFYYRLVDEGNGLDRNYAFLNYGMYVRCVKNLPN